MITDGLKFERLVVVSFAEGTNWITQSYDNQKLPQAMRKICDIIGERVQSTTVTKQ